MKIVTIKNFAWAMVAAGAAIGMLFALLVAGITLALTSPLIYLPGFWFVTSMVFSMASAICGYELFERVRVGETVLVWDAAEDG